ncbi:hypothetical protein PAPH110629_16805 [Paenibacillus phoenicis]
MLRVMDIFGVCQEFSYYEVSQLNLVSLFLIYDSCSRERTIKNWGEQARYTNCSPTIAQTMIKLVETLLISYHTRSYGRAMVSGPPANHLLKSPC